MVENRLSPIAVPVAMIHVGVLSFVSFLIVVFAQDLEISRIGMAGVIFSTFLMIAGLIAILLYRRKPSYFDDTTSVLKAMAIFFVPMIAYISLPFVVVLFAPFGFLAIPLTPVFSQFYITMHLSYYTMGYCHLLKSDKTTPIKCIIFVYFLFLNAGLFFAIREFFMNHVHSSFS